MPSRKRAKGRERKLKQQARETVERSVSQPPPNDGNKCDHVGFQLETLQGHPVGDFMNSFIEAVTSVVSIKESLRMTFEKHEEVWKDDGMRKMAIDTIVSFGTDMIIGKSIKGARTGSESIIYLEKYTSEDTYDSVLSKATEDIGYLLIAGEREVVHFYKKRIACSCLDELYSEIKKCQVRGSNCYYCNQTIRRQNIKTCSRCKFAQYCSKECQKLAWPFHKENCMKVASFHKRVNKVETAKSNKGI